MGASPGPWRWGWKHRAENETALYLESADPGMDRVLAVEPWVDEPGIEVSGNADATLIRLAPDMASMLRELEWEGRTEGGIFICPICRGSESVGHAPDCRLSALLAEIPK